MHYDNLMRSLFQAGPAELRWGATGLAVVASAVWTAVTGVLAVVMVLLFCVDVVLGVFKAVHRGGLNAFEWERFMRGAVKFGAAMAGVVLGVCVDLLLEQTGTVAATLTTTGVLAFMCVGFGASAAGSLSYFFPGVERLLDRAMGRAENGDGTIHPMRRQSDTPKEGGAS